MMQLGRSELVPPTSVAQGEVRFECTVRVVEREDGVPNFLGASAHGPPSARFLYVNAGRQAGDVNTCWDRRAKIPLGAITMAQVHDALANDHVLGVRIAGRAKDGGPVCATVKLPEGAWRVGE
jgi:hypothetical protein